MAKTHLDSARLAGHMPAQKLLDKVTTLYERFDPALISALDQIYDADVVFEDPLHRVEGLIELRRYFSGMVNGLDECGFTFNHILQQRGQGDEPDQAVLLWTMRYRHRKLKGGQLLSLEGSSHLQYRERVLYHRDYFDAGAMLYEQIPVLGYLIGKLKARLG